MSVIQTVPRNFGKSLSALFVTFKSLHTVNLSASDRCDALRSIFFRCPRTIRVGESFLCLTVVVITLHSAHAHDTSHRMWINFISNEWVARDTSHVAFSKASCTDSVSPFQNTRHKDVEEMYNRIICQCVRERTEDERQEKPAPNPRHWCVQHSCVRHLSLLPLSDPRSLSARRPIALASGQVKKRTHSQDLHFQIEVPVQDGGCVRSQRRDLNAAPQHAPQTVQQRRITASILHAGFQCTCG